MKRLMIAAMSSGSGKTVLTCGLLAALKARGIGVEGFKCGPDYIDPMFHRKVLGVPSRNLDLFLQGEQGLLATLGKQTKDVALVEGAMGFYDGVNGTHQASAWQVAQRLGLPVILALRPGGSSLTLAAQVKGMLDFRPDSQIRGMVLTACKPSLYAHLRPILEEETGLPVLGYLPPMEEARLESRHLGLLTAGEITDLNGRFAKIAARLEKTVDLDLLLSLAAEAPKPQGTGRKPSSCRCTIGVAWDEAFCFYYEDNFDTLRQSGAELCFFSPLGDAALPPVDGLYLGGGYPELYARKLSENKTMRDAIREAVQKGMPTVAECGGFLYLQAQLQTQEGENWPMVGLLPGLGYPTGQLRRFGYLSLCPEEDSLLFRAGEHIPAHEFHYWDTTENGADLPARKLSGRQWRCGLATPTFYGAFPHLHFGGAYPLADRFAAAAARYRERKSV